jgi:hypothetical protein
VHNNDFHGLAGTPNPVPFNRLEELLPRVIGALQQQGMVIHRRSPKVLAHFDK